MELTIDTSSEVICIVLSSQGEKVAGSCGHAGQNHTVELIPGLIELLDRAGMSLGEIGGLVVARGPGSFSGLRVGMSVVKGLALALEIPLAGISTLEAEAFPHAETGLPVCPILDAGRGEVAAALFQLQEGQWRRLVEEHVTTVDDLLTGIESPTVFCGRIPEEVAAKLRDGLGEKARIMEEITPLQRAEYLTQLGWTRLESGDFDHSPTLQPLYLRRPSITISRKKILFM